MSQVLHGGLRKRKPWTVQDQITAEVAAACGVSCKAIGRLLGRSDSVVTNHLCPEAAKKHRKSQRQYRNNNLEKVREGLRSWRVDNRQRNLELARNWRNANRDKSRASWLRYRKENIEKIREKQRSWYAANRNTKLERMRNWRQANRDRARQNIHRRKRWLRAGRQRALMPATANQITTRFALWSNCCAFCGVDATHQRNRGYERLTVEHVLAITKGGLDEASNIIPACSACNSSKHNSPVEAWYRRQLFFSETRWRKIPRHCPAAVAGQLPLAL